MKDFVNNRVFSSSGGGEDRLFGILQGQVQLAALVGFQLFHGCGQIADLVFQLLIVAQADRQKLGYSSRRSVMVVTSMTVISPMMRLRSRPVMMLTRAASC